MKPQWVCKSDRHNVCGIPSVFHNV